jgi:5-oxoprolinase (ATP-hydrolysing)
LKPGNEIDGPSILFQSISTIVLEIDCSALVTADGDLDITVARKKYEDDTKTAHQIKVDPVLLSIYAHRFMGIAEQMGRTLARTAISVNIKERLDFSVSKVDGRKFSYCRWLFADTNYSFPTPVRSLY